MGIVGGEIGYRVLTRLWPGGGAAHASGAQDGRSCAPPPRAGSSPSSPGSPPSSRRGATLPLLVIVAAYALYIYGVPDDLPGFFTDESSVAYNALKIARTGRDEHGVLMPLYFRAFGEYKNPVFVYLLAGLYGLVGPGVLAARLLSCTLGFLAALSLGRLASRLSGRPFVGVFVALTALLTPWLVEVSRPAFEVSIYPLALALFLLALHRAAGRERWGWGDSVSLALALALLTYAYTVGRLLAPLLAAGLILFAGRGRLAGVIKTWIGYAVTLIPLGVFALSNPGAFSARFYDTTYITPGMPVAEIAVRFVKHALHNVSLVRLLSQPIVGGAEWPAVSSVLLPTAVLAGAGVALALWRRRGDPWWRYMLYGLAASVVPASLADDYFHILRLVPYVVFLLIFTVPALEWLGGGGARWRRHALALLSALTLAQGALFWWQYRRASPLRATAYDASYPRVLDAALATSRRPVYLEQAAYPPDSGRYVHAYWYGALRGVDGSQFVRLAVGERAPAGSVVISTAGSCSDCDVVLSAPSSYKLASGEWSPYLVFVAR